MSSTHQLRCIGCGARIDAASAASDFRCPDCQGLYEVIYPWSPGASAGQAATATPVRLPNPMGLRSRWQELRTSTLPIDQSGVWRFRDLLPILDNFDHVVTLREGNTPLYEMPRCAESAGVDWLFAKHQGMNPTASFKDTGMTAAISVAVERGFQWVACASTGNTSAAMAAYAARAGLRSIVFIPEGKIAWGKLSQSMDYGAMTVQLKTDFDGCVRLLLELVRRFPIYLLNSVNPYRLEGQKTPAIEIVEQLEWQVPEHIVVPGGNLANSSALGKGFMEMKHLGLIPRDPGPGRQPALQLVQRHQPRDEARRRRDSRHRNPHRQSRELEESRACHRRDGRMVRAGQRAGDRARQSGDRSRRCGLRTRVRRY